VWTAQNALFDYARAHAQDLVSDVITDVGRGAFHALPDADHQAVGFIESVIRNRANHINRREARLVSLSGDEPSSDPHDPWQRGARVLLVRDVADALSRLTPREREVAAMHWLDQWSSPEIAGALGISVRTVKELLRRARRGLRAHLARYGGGET
jgi:RNA polymerase sigma factor (sigma-70 family)